MIPTIRAEFRKLFTVRSTYVLIGFCLFITVFIAMYALGYRAPASAGDNPGLMGVAITTVAQFTGLFIALIAILLVTHEYRYNTIMYTLMAAKHRWYVWLAKIIAASTLAIVLSLVIALLTPLLLRFGLHLQDTVMAPQNIDLPKVLLHTTVYDWAYTMVGLSLAMILRSQVGAIVTILVFPTIGETLLSLVLQDNVKYLPFNILAQFLNSDSTASLAEGSLKLGTVTLVMFGYIVVGWAVSLLLLNRRDAN